MEAAREEAKITISALKAELGAAVLMLAEQDKTVESSKRLPLEAAREVTAQIR
jgi:hypothetical protein